MIAARPWHLNVTWLDDVADLDEDYETAEQARDHALAIRATCEQFCQADVWADDDRFGQPMIYRLCCECHECEVPEADATRCLVCDAERIEGYPGGPAEVTPPNPAERRTGGQERKT